MLLPPPTKVGCVLPLQQPMPLLLLYAQHLSLVDLVQILNQALQQQFIPPLSSHFNRQKGHFPHHFKHLLLSNYLNCHFHLQFEPQFLYLHLEKHLEQHLHPHPTALGHR
jgi:hypothetical protein